MSEPTHFECDCVPNLGPPHCHACTDEVGNPVMWSACPQSAPVLPSSTESPVEPFKTWFACWWKNEPNAIAESNAQSAFYAGWDARGLPSSGVDEDDCWHEANCGCIRAGNVDEEKLAEVIRKLRFYDAPCWADGIDCTESVSDHADDIARAVAEWLKGQGGESRGE